MSVGLPAGAGPAPQPFSTGKDFMQQFLQLTVDGLTIGALYSVIALGATLFASNLAGKEFGRQNVPVPPLFTNGVLFHIGGAEVTVQTLFIFVTAAAMLVLLERLVNGTRLGSGIRSVAQDADTAS